jgi:hypothetical protein
VVRDSLLPTLAQQIVRIPTLVERPAWVRLFLFSVSHGSGRDRTGLPVSLVLANLFYFFQPRSGPFNRSRKSAPKFGRQHIQI